MAFNYTRLFMAIQEYDPDRQRVNHLLKVDGYANIIGRWEKLSDGEQSVLRLAAMLHDIGVKTSLEAGGDDPGAVAENSAALADDFLRRLGCSGAVVERVSRLIRRHHNREEVDGKDGQILLEADFIVNCDEKALPADRVGEIRDRHFRTVAGTRILSLLFKL